MASLNSKSLPARGSSWADDDEDDWNFDDHMMRYGNVQGPTLAELGPLQHTASSSDDMEHENQAAPLETLFVEEYAASSSSVIELEHQAAPLETVEECAASFRNDIELEYQTAPVEIPFAEECAVSFSNDMELKYQTTTLETPSIEEYAASFASDQPQVQGAYITPAPYYTPYNTAYRAMAVCEIFERYPAYPELSQDAYGNIFLFRRVNYSFNWRQKKINDAKLRAQDQFHYKISKLYEEMRLDDMNLMQAQDSVSVQNTAIAVLDHQDSSDTEESASTPATSPSVLDDGRKDDPENLESNPRAEPAEGVKMTTTLTEANSFLPTQPDTLFSDPTNEIAEKPSSPESPEAAIDLPASTLDVTLKNLAFKEDYSSKGEKDAEAAEHNSTDSNSLAIDTPSTLSSGGIDEVTDGAVLSTIPISEDGIYESSTKHLCTAAGFGLMDPYCLVSKLYKSPHQVIFYTPAEDMGIDDIDIPKLSDDTLHNNTAATDQAAHTTTPEICVRSTSSIGVSPSSPSVNELQHCHELAPSSHKEPSGWAGFTSAAWKSVGLAAIGAVVLGGIHLARRRS